LADAPLIDAEILFRQPGPAQTERLMANRAAAARKWVIKIRMSDPSSISWCLVDDRERLVTHFPAA